MRRWVLIGLGLLVGLAVAGSLALKLVFPPEALRALAVPQIERRVGRPVDIEAVSLKIFPRIAIRLSDVRIPNPPGFSPEPTVRLEALDIELRFWPLLRKQLVFRQISLRTPTIRYEIASDGSNNLAGLGADSAPSSRSGTAGSSVLLVNDFRLIDGTVIYRNSLTGQGAWLGVEAQARLDPVGGGGLESTGEILLDNVNVLLGDADADSLAIPDLRIRYSVITYPAGDSVSVPDLAVLIGDVPLNGWAVMRDLAGQKEVDLELVSDAIDLAGIMSALPAGTLPEGLSVEGSATATLAASGLLSGGEAPLDVGATVSLVDVAAELPDYGRLVTSTSGDLMLDRSSVRAPALKGMLWDRPLTIAFGITDFADPQVTGRATGAVALGQLPSGVAPGATGDAAFDITFNGPAKEPALLNLTGPVELTNVVFQHAALAVPARITRAVVQLTGAGVVANAVPVKMGKSDATITLRSAGMVRHFLARDSSTALPPVTFTVTSTLLDVGELSPDTGGYSYGNLLSARLAGKQLQGQDPGVIARQRYRVPSRRPTTVDGRIQIAELLNPPTRGRNIAFDIRLAEDILEVKNLSGQLYDGNLNGELALDLRPGTAPYPVRYAVELRGAEASHFLPRWTRLSSAITGTVDFDIDGEADLDEGLLPRVESMVASGNSNFRDGQFQEFGPARALMERLQLQGPERRTFRQLGGIFTIERGALVVDDWSYRGADVSGSITGSAALNGGIDLTLGLKVPPEILNQAGLLQGSTALAGLMRQLAGTDQTLDLVVGMGGTVSNPALRVDTEGLRRELERRLANEGRGVLDRLLPRAGQKP